jgi:hypothetical protein
VEIMGSGPIEEPIRLKRWLGVRGGLAPTAAVIGLIAMVTIADARVAVGEAEKRIQRNVDHITARLRAMDTKYQGPRAAEKTLTEAIRAKREKGAYAGNYFYIGWDWHRVRDFYERHRRALTDSLDVVRTQGYAEPDDLTALDRGMEAWTRHEAHIQQQMARYVDMWATRMSSAGADWDRLREQYGLRSTPDLFQALSARRDRPGPVEVRFVRAVGNGYEPIADEIKYGERFYVEARFENAPTERQKRVTLDWGEARRIETELKPTDVEHLFRSGPLYLQAPPPPAAGRTSTR